MDNSFEQNRKQIQQTHEIINVIEQKLNSFLQRKNVVSPESMKHSNQRHSNETFLLSSNTLEKSSDRHVEMKFKQLQYELMNKPAVVQENKQQEINEKEMKERLQQELDDRIQEQRELMQQQFETQVNEITERTKQQLLEIISNDDGNQKVEDLQKEVEQLKKELQELYHENQRSVEARDELQSTYEHLLNMHNTMTRVEGNMEKRFETVRSQQTYRQPNLTHALHQYKQELKGLREKNISIQEHMAKELSELKFCLEQNKNIVLEEPRKMSEFEVLVDSKNSNQSSLESQKFYQTSIENQDLSSYLREPKQLVPLDTNKISKQKVSNTKFNKKVDTQKSEKKDKSQESQNNMQKIYKDQQIELFQMELQHLKNIVHDKIISKKTKQK